MQPSQRDGKRLPIAAPAGPRLVSPECVSHPVCKAPFEVNWKRASLSGRHPSAHRRGRVGISRAPAVRLRQVPRQTGLRRSAHPRNSVLGGSLPSARCLVALQEPGSPVRLFFNQERVNNVLSPERSTAVSSLGGRRKTKRLLSAFDRGEFFCPAAFLLLL